MLIVFSLGFAVYLLVSAVIPILAVNSEQTAGRRFIVFICIVEQIQTEMPTRPSAGPAGAEVSVETG